MVGMPPGWREKKTMLIVISYAMVGKASVG